MLFIPCSFNPNLLWRHYLYTNARKSAPPPQILHCSKRSGSNSSLHWGLVFYPIQPNSCFFRLLFSRHYIFRGNLKSLNMAINIQEVEVDQTSASASEACHLICTSGAPHPPEPYPRGNGCGLVQHPSSQH